MGLENLNRRLVDRAAEAVTDAAIDAEEATLGTAIAGTARAIWVGTGGGIKVTTLAGTAVNILNIPDGALLPIAATAVADPDSGTAASNVVVLY